MTLVYEAIYENGIFRPLTMPAPGLAEGQQVRLVVETQPADDLLALAARVYEGLSEQDVDDVERVALDRSAFFARAHK